MDLKEPNYSKLKAFSLLAAKKLMTILGAAGKALWKGLKAAVSLALAHWKLAGVVVLVLAAVALTVVVMQLRQNSRHESKEIVIEDTPILIEDVRPRGEIYVCSSVYEDYATERRTEQHLGFIPEQHSCIQILRQKVCYKIDLDKVTYTPDTLNAVVVRMPEIEYTASTQSSPFLSDDEDYWKKALPCTNALKQKVERQIRGRFDTPENRRKAEKYAKEAMAELLGKLGYEARFEPEVTRPRKD